MTAKPDKNDRHSKQDILEHAHGMIAEFCVLSDSSYLDLLNAFTRAIYPKRDDDTLSSSSGSRFHANIRECKRNKHHDFSQHIHIAHFSQLQWMATLAERPECMLSTAHHLLLFFNYVFVPGVQQVRTQQVRDELVLQCLLSMDPENRTQWTQLLQRYCLPPDLCPYYADMLALEGQSTLSTPWQRFEQRHPWTAFTAALAQWCSNVLRELQLSVHDTLLFRIAQNVSASLTLPSSDGHSVPFAIHAVPNGDNGHQSRMRHANRRSDREQQQQQAEEDEEDVFPEHGGGRYIERSELQTNTLPVPAPVVFQEPSENTETTALVTVAESLSLVDDDDDGDDAEREPQHVEEQIGNTVNTHADIDDDDEDDDDDDGEDGPHLSMPSLEQDSQMIYSHEDIDVIREVLESTQEEEEEEDEEYTHTTTTTTVTVTRTNMQQLMEIDDAVEDENDGEHHRILTQPNELEVRLLPVPQTSSNEQQEEEEEEEEEDDADDDDDDDDRHYGSMPTSLCDTDSHEEITPTAMTTSTATMMQSLLQSQRESQSQPSEQTQPALLTGFHFGALPSQTNMQMTPTQFLPQELTPQEADPEQEQRNTADYDYLSQNKPPPKHQQQEQQQPNAVRGRKRSYEEMVSQEQVNEREHDTQSAAAVETTCMPQAKRPRVHAPAAAAVVHDSQTAIKSNWPLWMRRHVSLTVELDDEFLVANVRKVATNYVLVKIVDEDAPNLYRNQQIRVFLKDQHKLEPLQDIGGGAGGGGGGEDDDNDDAEQTHSHQEQPQLQTQTIETNAAAPPPTTTTTSTSSTSSSAYEVHFGHQRKNAVSDIDAAIIWNEKQSQDDLSTPTDSSQSQTQTQSQPQTKESQPQSQNTSAAAAARRSVRFDLTLSQETKASENEQREEERRKQQEQQQQKRLTNRPLRVGGRSGVRRPFSKRRASAADAAHNQPDHNHNHNHKGRSGGGRFSAAFADDDDEEEEEEEDGGEEEQEAVGENGETMQWSDAEEHEDEDDEDEEEDENTSNVFDKIRDSMSKSKKKSRTEFPPHIVDAELVKNPLKYCGDKEAAKRVRRKLKGSAAAADGDGEDGEGGGGGKKQKRKVFTRAKWSDAEIDALVEGYEKYQQHEHPAPGQKGIWAYIMRDPKLGKVLAKRNNQQLSDKCRHLFQTKDPRVQHLISHNARTQNSNSKKKKKKTKKLSTRAIP